MTTPAKAKIIIAADVPDATAAGRLADSLAGQAQWIKIGLQLFSAEGPSIVRMMQQAGFKIFLDLKFHDIPNTAREAIHSVCALGIGMTTIHLSGGPAMTAEAVKAAAGTSTLVLGVTVLTSMDDESLSIIGVQSRAAEHVIHLAEMGANCGLRGVVASPQEITALREEFGNSLTIVTPGVRPAGSDTGDQRRVMTPGEAIRCGADYLVIGRPITGALSPRDAFLRIADEVEAAGN